MPLSETNQREEERKKSPYRRVSVPMEYTIPLK